MHGVGITINVLVGKESNGSVSSIGRVLNAVSETDSKETLTCDSGKHGCWLVGYVRSAAIRQLDGYYVHKMDDLVLGQRQLPRGVS